MWPNFQLGQIELRAEQHDAFLIRTPLNIAEFFIVRSAHFRSRDHRPCGRIFDPEVESDVAVSSIRMQLIYVRRLQIDGEGSRAPDGARS